MRRNPRAFMIYSRALRLTKGGKNQYYESQPRVAAYFGWNIKTVRKAIRALLRAGLFDLLREGRGGNGQLNYASVYRVIKHPELRKADNCRPSGNDRLESHGAKDGSDPVPVFGTQSLPSTGTLVSEQSAKESSSPSQAALAPGITNSASPQKVKTNPSLLPKKKELPESFRPDQNNVQFAMQNGLDLEEELAEFSDMHRSIGNERSNWQAVFHQWLANALRARGKRR
jgi:hypothetical protein